MSPAADLCPPSGMVALTHCHSSAALRKRSIHVNHVPHWPPLFGPCVTPLLPLSVMKVIATILAAAAALLSFSSVNAEVFMKETFDDAEWEQRWTVGEEWKPSSQMGEWKWVTPKYQEDGKAIKTGEDARFYSLSAPLDAEVSNSEWSPTISTKTYFECAFNVDCLR